jgi:hypothetical protein
LGESLKASRFPLILPLKLLLKLQNKFWRFKIAHTLLSLRACVATTYCAHSWW